MKNNLTSVHLIYSSENGVCEVCGVTARKPEPRQEVCSSCASSFTYAADGRCPVCGEAGPGSLATVADVAHALLQSKRPTAVSANEPWDLRLPPEPALHPPHAPSACFHGKQASASCEQPLSGVENTRQRAVLSHHVPGVRDEDASPKHRPAIEDRSLTHRPNIFFV